MSWKVLRLVNFCEKYWKSIGILHHICLMNFLFQVVCNEFLPSFCVRYSTSFFLVYLPVSRIKYKKYCSLLTRDYFLFVFDTKCIKIIVISKQDGLKTNGSSIELGKK